jgi:adenylate cyclase
MSFFAELKRRNVFKVAAAYIIVSWLIMQGGEVMAPALNLPGWVNSMLAFFLILGFPLAMFFAWAFELTPEGIKKEKDVVRNQSITQITSRKLDFIIIGLLAVALVYFVWEARFQTDDVRSMQGEVELVEDQPGTRTDHGVSAKTSTSQKPDANSIAVLPFINMSDDASNEFFSDGITEELLNLLAKIPELKVTSRSSAFSFKGQSTDIPTMAKKLNVAHVLEGSVRKAGNRVRITAQLIKADSDVHMWSETYDRELDDVFAIQDEIAREVVKVLQLKLLGEVPTTPTTNTEAYTQYLRGHHFFAKSTKESWASAETAYRKALDIDPDFAPAWAGLAFTLRVQANYGYIDLHDGTETARKAAQRALELDDTLADAWAALALIQFVYDWDWDRAAGTIRTALQYGPRNDVVLRQAANIARGLGDAKSAVEYSEFAVELDPLSQTSLRALIVTYWGVSRQSEASATIQRSLELYADQPDLTAWIASGLVLQGRPEEARQHIEKDSDNFWQIMFASMVANDLGRHEEAEQALQRLITEHKDSMAFQAAEIYAWQGNKDKAYEWLEIAYEQRDGGFTQILMDPFLASLHDDPRWEQILDRVGLLKYWQKLNSNQAGTGS